MAIKYNTISFEEAGKIMESGKDYVLLDVREEFEYLTGHAEGAKLLPLDTIEEETAKEKIPTKDTIVLAYCKSGKRSSMAMDRLKALGYRNVESLGSLVGWPYGISHEEEEYDF